MVEPRAMANWMTATIKPPPASASCGMACAIQFHQPTGLAVPINPHNPSSTATVSTHAPHGINATAITDMRVGIVMSGPYKPHLWGSQMHWVS